MISMLGNEKILLPNGELAASGHVEVLSIQQARAVELAALELGSAVVERLADESERYIPPFRVIDIINGHYESERVDPYGSVGRKVPNGMAAICIIACDTGEVRKRSWVLENCPAEDLEQDIKLKLKKSRYRPRVVVAP